MSMSENYRRIVMQNNALREQNDKLQGSIRILQANTEAMQIKLEELEKEKDKYKKGFDDIFIKNVGSCWDKVDEAVKKRMDITDKIHFFNRENNNTKVYIRDFMKKKIEELKKENEELKEKLKEKETEYENLKAGIQAEMNANLKTNSSPQSKPSETEMQEPANESSQTAPPKTTSIMNKFRNKNKREQSTASGNNAKTQVNDTKKQTSSAIKNISPSEINYVKNLLDDKLPSSVKDFLNKMSAQLGSARVSTIKDKTAEKVTLYSLVIATMGETGLYTVKDIMAHIKDSYGQSVTEVKVSDALNGLSENKLVEEKEIKVGGVGRPSKKYVLTDVSKYYYALCNTANPVPSEVDIVTNEQKSGSHGLTIVKIIGALTNAGYDCEQEVHRTASNGEDTIADIVATKDGKMYYIEYEEGNYSREQYEYKTKKILSLGDVIYIVKDTSVKEKLVLLVKNMTRKYFMETAQMRKYVVETVANLQQNPDVIKKGK